MCAPPPTSLSYYLKRILFIKRILSSCITIWFIRRMRLINVLEGCGLTRNELLPTRKRDSKFDLRRGLRFSRKRLLDAKERWMAMFYLPWNDCYTMEYKLEVVKFYWENNLYQTAKWFSLNTKTVGSWCREEQEGIQLWAWLTALKHILFIKRILACSLPL